VPSRFRASAIPLLGQCAPPARSAALARRQGHAAVASARVESIRCAAARRRALRDRGVRRGERVRRRGPPRRRTSRTPRRA
jgi:hypothetical protein